MSSGGDGGETSSRRKRARRVSTDEIPTRKRQPMEGTSKSEALPKTNTNAETHRNEIKINREYLVKNIDLTRTSILDCLVGHDVLGHEQLKAIKESNKTNLQLVGALLDHLYSRPYKDWKTFLTCLAEHGQRHIVENLQEYVKPTVYLLESGDDLNMRAVLEETESIIKFVDKTIETKILTEQKLQDEKIQKEIKNCVRKKIIRVIPYTRKAAFECPQRYDEDTCCIVFISNQMTGNKTEEYQQYMNHSGWTGFLSPELLKTWKCQLDSSHSNKFQVFIPCNIKFDESFFVSKDPEEPVRVVVDMQYNTRITEMLKYILPAIENTILQREIELIYILLSSSGDHQEAVTFKEKRKNKTPKIECIHCKNKSKINELKENSIWIHPGGSTHLTWTSLLPSTHGIPQIIAKTSHIYKTYKYIKEVDTVEEADVRSLDKCLHLIEWGNKPAENNLEKCLRTILENYGEAIDRAKLISKWFLCNGSVITSTSRFLRFVLGGTLAKIHIRIIGEIEERTADIIGPLQRALIARGDKPLYKLVREAWEKHANNQIVDITQGSIVLHIYIPDIESMEYLQTCFKRGNIGEAVLEILLLLWKTPYKKESMSQVSLEMMLTAPSGLRQQFQAEGSHSAMDTRKKDGRDLCCRAASAGATAVMLYLISEGHLGKCHEGSGSTLLLEACRAGHLETVQLILEKCGDIDKSHMVEAVTQAQEHPKLVEFLEMKIKSTNRHDHQTIIRDNRDLLMSRLDLVNTNVLEDLVANGVLPWHKFMSIQDRGTTNVQWSSALLDHLCTRPYADWQKFTKVLSQNGQGYILEGLRGCNIGHTSLPLDLKSSDLTSEEAQGQSCREHEKLLRIMPQFDHRHIIQHNRVFLVESIDLNKTSILDRLVQDGVLSTEQGMAIKSTGYTNAQRVSALLDHLHGRTTQDWTTFLTCLSDNNHQGVVNRIKASVLGHSGQSVVRLQHKMVEIILQLYYKIPMWTLHSDFCRVPLEIMYVDLVLVKDKQRTLGKEEHLRGYKDIFRKSGQRNTIYLSGEPGVGKSTFTQHLCVEWAKIHDKDTEVQEQTDYTFDNYQFVLPLFLRDVKKEQTLCDVMAEEYQMGKNEAEELYHHINKPEVPVLIIADGLDEYSDSTSEEITKLLLRQILPNSTLFITSRFSPETFYTKKNFQPDTEVALRGFSEAGVKEYLLKFFNQNEEKRDALIKEIKKSEELVHLSHCPAMLLMMATLGEENQKLPSTITGFYEEFVAYVFARMEKKIKNVADRAKSTEEILKRYNTQIMAFGCLATGNVKTHKLELKFKREDVDKHISSEDLKTGFLIEKCTFSREIFYIFIHKTLQEFFLAYYLVHSDKSTQQELLLRFFNSRQAFMESAMIRRFVSGLGGEEIHKKLEMMIDRDEREVAEMHTDLQLEYLAEHQDATLTLPRGVGLYITGRYPASHYVRYLTQNGGEVGKMWVTGDVRHWRLLQHLHAPQLTCLTLLRWSWSPCSVDKQYITQTLDRTLTKFSLKQLTVSGLLGYIDDNEASEVFRAVVQTQTLNVLSLHLTPLTGDSIQTLTEWLPGCHLTSVEMSYCNLTSQEMMAALSVLPPSLQTLNVSYNDLTGLTDTGQWSGVTRSQIQTLYMSGCHLTSRGVLAVIDAAPETLTDLDVRGNCREGEGDDLVKVTERTTQLNKLKTLNLQYNNMSRDVVRTIKQKLTETCPHLELRIDEQIVLPNLPYSDESEETDSDSDESEETDSDSDESEETDRDQSSGTNKRTFLFEKPQTKKK